LATFDYVTADVFTTSAFGGNPLAVLTDARGLTTEQMHAIAREFNYSETTFVLPPKDARNTRHVRIFTPSGEVPFAGHPTVGTAFVLAAIGDIALSGEDTHVVFEEIVGPVPVRIAAEHGRPHFTELSVAKLPEVMPPLPSNAELAAMLTLEDEDLIGGSWHPQAVSCGLPFSFVPLRDRGAVARARLKTELWEKSLQHTPYNNVMVFALDPEHPGHHVRARCFVPGESVPEDPATGSACAALGGYLALRDSSTDTTLRWIVEQGYEMRRPSQIHVEVDRNGGRTTAVRVGGSSVLVCKGQITIP
jgi:trans-2,3-dihydro-3-hydroxyanthranilate isomerase